MTEKDLIELGFLRDEGEWTGSSDDKWYYYTLDIGIDKFNQLCLITQSSDEVENGEWKVRIFDNDSFEFTNRFQLEKLIETLKYNMVKNVGMEQRTK
jgi:hypothetical protein